jgi:hypothetical protein
MNIASNYITDFHKKQLIKGAKYEEKQRRKAIESLTIEEHKIVKSIVVQFFCTTALQLELIDKLNEVSNIAMKYPFITDFMKGIEMLNTDLYRISIKTEKDDINRQELEKMMSNIIGKMPTLSLKQLELLEEFINNLKHKS